jgi:hypothetical protein
MLVIDDFSKLMWVAFLREKFDAFEKFKKFKAICSNRGVECSLGDFK